MVVEFKSVTLTDRAKATMRARDVSPDDLAEVLTHPKVVEPTYSRLRLTRDDLCVEVSLDAGDAVVTRVLLLQCGQWSEEDIRN